MIIAKLKYYDMPENCCGCDPDLAQAIHCNHWMEGQMFYSERPPMCPLIEINDEDLMNMYEAVKRIHKVKTVTVKRGTVDVG